MYMKIEVYINHKLFCITQQVFVSAFVIQPRQGNPGQEIKAEKITINDTIGTPQEMESNEMTSQRTSQVTKRGKWMCIHPQLLSISTCGLEKSAKKIFILKITGFFVWVTHKEMMYYSLLFHSGNYNHLYTIYGRNLLTGI